MPNREFDVIMFGATGFTGGLCADYLAQREGSSFSFAIAGRSRAKLEKVQARLRELAPDREVPIVVADSADAASLRAMCARTQVVATTVGPFERYGYELVAACVEEGTDYADITGEPQFVDEVIARHHEAAAAKGVRIVSCCGFDSIPHDLGAWMTACALPDDAPMKIEGVVYSSGTFSGGTWHSAVNAMAKFREHTRARKERGRPKREGRKVGSVKAGVHYEKRIKGWMVPLPTIDPEIVKRSARALAPYGTEFRYGHYVRVRKLHTVVGGGLAVGGIFAGAQFSPTRKLLLKVKDPGDGPSAKERARAFFEVTFFGEAGGYEVVGKVKGKDPGYDETAKMLAESALCLAQDRDQLDRVGVVTPAMAMAAPLIDRLRDHGMTFEVLA